MSSRKPRRTEKSTLTTIGIIVYSRQYRTALTRSLKGADGLVPVDLGDGNEESLRQLGHEQPQALLVDLPPRRLAALLRAAHAQQPSLPILAVNCDEEESELLALFEAGLTGFVPHNAGTSELVWAIQAALAGEFHCPPRIAAALVHRVNAAGETGGSTAVLTRFTTREVQIVQLLEQSMTNKEIAVRLGIGTETVRNHVYRICCKIHVHRRTEVVARVQEGASFLRVVPGRDRGPLDGRAR